MKTLFKYLSAAFLFCAALNANTQAAGLVNYQGKITFPKEIIAACPLLNKGDTAPIYGSTFGLGKTKVNLGTLPFTTTTSSGVPVTGEGTLIANATGGTFYVTAMTIGDPLGDNCSFVNINLPVNLNVDHYHPGGFF